jgi:hypothetical protein
MKRLLCKDCQGNLCNDEIALNLKLRSRSVGTFFCLNCLSHRMDCPKETLIEMVAIYRENGCELFSYQYVEQGSENA